MITMVSDHIIRSHSGHSDDGPGDDHKCDDDLCGWEQKCDHGQSKDVESLVVSVAQSYGRSDDGQCDDHVGQREVDAIITLVSDHIIGHSHIGQFDEGQCDAHIGQCAIIGLSVMVMVDHGQRDDQIGQ